MQIKWFALLIFMIWLKSLWFMGISPKALHNIRRYHQWILVFFVLKLAYVVIAQTWCCHWNHGNWQVTKELLKRGEISLQVCVWSNKLFSSYFTFMRVMCVFCVVTIATVTLIILMLVMNVQIRSACVCWGCFCDGQAYMLLIFCFISVLFFSSCCRTLPSFSDIKKLC